MSGELDQAIDVRLFGGRADGAWNAYSTNIVYAWWVVEKMLADGFDTFSLLTDPFGRDRMGYEWRWQALFSDGNRHLGHGATAPEAICRAALAALEARQAEP